jgi:uncharacterized tellurite resistance protein B-like protein
MDEDFARWELELAFTWHVVHQILEADGGVSEVERAFVLRHLPAGVLQKAGFVDAAGGFLPRFQDALGEALLVLPALPVADRQQLVRTLFRAALSDDELARAEETTVRRAARLLGLGESDYLAVVDGLVTSEVTLEDGTEAS